VGYKKFVKDEKGAVAVLVAILLTVFIGVTALVVDYGFLAYTRRNLQIAADAAALAGAQEMLILGDEASANQALIYQKVKEYAEINGISESELIPAPDINVDEGYVKVVAERDVSNFFAHVIGFNTSKVVARAKAKIVWISGLGGLVPFGVVDVRPTEVRAGFSGDLKVLTDGNNDSVYETDQVKAPSSPGSNKIIVQATDSRTGAVVEADPAAAVMVGSSLVKRVTLVSEEKYNFTSPGKAVSATVALDTTSTPDSVILSIGSSDHALLHNSVDGSGNLVYSDSFYAPSANTYPVNVKVIQSGVEEVIGPVTYLRVIDGFYNIGSVRAYPTSGLPGQNITIQAEIKGFEFGDKYDLKLNASPESGNFMLVRFDGEQGNDAMEKILTGSETEYYVGDIIQTEPGNKPGLVTGNNGYLMERIGTDTCDWESWENRDTRHMGCPRLVTVPLVIAYGNGMTDVMITGFATFFIETVDPKTDSIEGYFVEYPEVGKGWTEEDPNDPLRPKTVRLVPFD